MEARRAGDQAEALLRRFQLPGHRMLSVLDCRPTPTSPIATR
jgi:hypothetical protein